MTSAPPKVENPGYHQEWRNQMRAGSIQSAETVLGLIFPLLNPKSVVDVGSGEGMWLAVCRELGAETLQGFDGEWVKEEKLLVNKDEFQKKNLEKPLGDIGRFDLCISMEVAEHLSPGRAESLVDDLTNAADHILFSAAIPGQGGINHINEQWQSYWVEKFEKRGYEAVDYIRPLTWDNKDVRWWYRQNALLFIKKETLGQAPQELVECTKRPRQIDIVHPESWEAKHQDYLDMVAMYKKTLTKPDLRFILGRVKWYLKNLIGAK